MPILAVVGIPLTGEREVLGFSVGDRENQLAWEALLDDLKERGVKDIGLWVSDGNQTMLNAIASKFPSSSRQRCALHKMENVLSYVPNKQREQMEPELKALFYPQESRGSRSSSRSVYRKIPEELSHSDCLLTTGFGGMFDLLLLSKGALEDDTDQQYY